MKEEFISRGVEKTGVVLYNELFRRYGKKVKEYMTIYVHKEVLESTGKTMVTYQVKEPLEMLPVSLYTDLWEGPDDLEIVMVKLNKDVYMLTKEEVDELMKDFKRVDEVENPVEPEKQEEPGEASEKEEEPEKQEDVQEPANN